MNKCAEFVKYVNATAQNLTLDVAASCVNGSTSDGCVAKIKNNEADLVTLDGGRVYYAGKIIMQSHINDFYSGPLVGMHAF